VARKVTSPGTARPDWMIAVDLARRLGTDLGIASPDDVWAELATVSPIHAHIDPEALTAATREGILVRGGPALARPAPLEVPSHDKNSFRLVVTRSMYDRGVLTAHSPSLAGLAPVTRLAFEPTDFASLGVPEGGSIEVRGPKGNASVVVGPDARVAKGTAHVLFNQQGVSAGDLIDAAAAVIDLTVVPV